MSCGGVLTEDCGCGCDECAGVAGATGATGATGASAYEIWIAEGNVGTEQDFLDSLVGADGTCVCEEVMFTADRLGANSVGTSPTMAIVSSSDYTVPALGDGTYRVFYSAEVLFDDVAGGSLVMQLYKNGAPYLALTRDVVMPISCTIPTNMNYSDIDLVAGDIIAFYGMSDDPTVTYLSDATCIIEKIA